jgi:FG-GAP-like repeat
MNAVARTWTQATGLRFTGWGECPQPGTPKTINVGMNTFNVGCDAAQTCTPSNGCTDRIDINVCPPAWEDVTLIHEFGHALGFAHEMDRPDFPDYGTCTEGNQSGGDYLHTIPDKNSIMNGTYCHMNPELSYFDISGSQNLWGRQNFFADVTGDGRADAIVVNPDGVWVRVTNSRGRMPAATQRNWTGAGFWGWKGTHFADVDGDGRADLIAVDDGGIAVRLSTGTGTRRNPRRFAPATYWTSGPYWGERGTYFADVTGDGRADAIVVGNDGRVFVSISDGSKFVPDKYWLTTVPNNREPKNYFADVTGPDHDGRRRADLIAINTEGIVVCPALVEGGFGTCVNWTGNTAFWGTRATLFADYDGDGRADVIAINSNTSGGAGIDVQVGFSNGHSFSAANL